MNAATDFLPASGLLAQLDLLRIEHAGAVTHLCLNRPAKRNAINEELMRQLHTALLNLPASAKALVISGEGDHFCAGLDLSDLSERSVAEGVLHSRGWHVVMDALQFCRVPVVAALHGAVVGGGLELAAAWPTTPPTSPCPKASAASSSAAAARRASRAWPAPPA
jgi:enoyl-CoA hydratase/carnithine racemase